MTFEELKDFILNKMKMSHIYQPLLIKTLLEYGGTSTIKQMAISFLAKDESQIAYYEKIIKNMPVKVLEKHGVLKKDNDLIKLNIKPVTLQQKAEISKLCESKIQEYIVSRGFSIWNHRLYDQDAISDILRYRVLKEAKGRCSLCGVTSKEAMLDIDHIIPRSKGGKTVYENLQVLCAKCNRSKSNKDDYDFRDLGLVSEKMECPFCLDLKDERIILANDYSYAILDKFPVTKGHTLVIPKRHFQDYFEITEKELIAINNLLTIRKKQLTESDKTIAGFNIGINSGNVAGQTIEHCHVHLIPRRSGDIKNPAGGVRGVIPEKQHYIIE